MGLSLLGTFFHALQHQNKHEQDILAPTTETIPTSTRLTLYHATMGFTTMPSCFVILQCPFLEAVPQNPRLCATNRSSHLPTDMLPFRHYLCCIFHTAIHFTQLSCQLSQSVPHHLSTIYGCHVSVRVIKIIRQTSYGCPASQFAALIRQTSYGCPTSQLAALGPSRPDPLPPAVVCWPLRREPDMKGLFRSDLENFCGLF